jgi:diadenylate cyclase
MVPSPIHDLLPRIRLADLADILVVATLVYGAIRWFKTARSRFVISGFVALAVLYGIARLLRMQLTLFLFQVGFTVALVAMVVIFQEEIRRAFERIGSSRLLPAARDTPGSPELIAAIVSTSAAMSANRIGALIVLRGKEPLERHVTGGVPLHGQASEPLLLSLFDPTSPGHDGAVLIDGDVITRFAVHLPLSTHVKENARQGTRHTAALGLSERSDALVVVVSEERGTISVARAGSLDPLHSPAELERRLTEFFREVAPAQHVPWQKRLFARNLPEKALSLAIAIGAWLAVFGYEGETAARTYSVPVVYRDIPEGWMIEEPKPHEVRVTVAAPAGAFQLLRPEDLSFRLDVGELRPGSQAVVLSEQSLSLPTGFSVHRIDPRQVMLVAHRTVEIRVPVRIVTRGELPRGLRVQKLSAEPERAPLLVRADARDRPGFVATEPIDLDQVGSTVTVRRPLITPNGTRLGGEAPKEVAVRIEVTGKAAP